MAEATATEANVTTSPTKLNPRGAIGKRLNGSSGEQATKIQSIGGLRSRINSLGDPKTPVVVETDSEPTKVNPQGAIGRRIADHPQEQPIIVKSEGGLLSRVNQLKVVPQPSAAAGTASETGVDTGALLYTDPEVAIKQEGIETLTDEEGLKVLTQAEIHSDDEVEEFKELLKKEDLMPKYKKAVGKAAVCFSSSGYDLRNGRIAVVGFVDSTDQRTGRRTLVGRSYYRSNSHGIWKYLPEYIQREGKIKLYGKGISQTSIAIPWQLQFTLFTITDRVPGHQGVKQTQTNPEDILKGTARHKYVNVNGTYYMEVAPEPIKLSGNFYAKDGLIPPDQVDFQDEGQKPNFQNLIASKSVQSELYGEMQMEVYQSINTKEGESLYYTFCRDKKGRAWIANIEPDGEIQSTGLKRNWVDSGCLVTPAMNYGEETFGYANPNKRGGRRAQYFDMYDNYLSKVPLIIEYQAVVANRNQHAFAST